MTLVARWKQLEGRPPWSVVLIAVAVAVVSLGLAVTGLVLRTTGDGSGDLEARGSALAAARERTLALTTYDYRTFDAAVAGVLATATEPFSTEYAATTAQLQETVTATKAIAESRVVGAGVESDADGRVVVIVAVDQVVRTAGAADQTEQNRLRMTLIRPDDTWLVERVERL